MDGSRTPAQAAMVDAEIDQIVGAASGSPTFDIADPAKINNAVLDALLARCPPDYLAERVWRLCEAKRRMKDGNEEDDVRANEAGLKLALAYSIGKPIERQQIITKTISSDPVADIEERLAKSPSLRRSLAATLAKVESQTVV
jgi:hypothetical protein